MFHLLKCQNADYSALDLIQGVRSPGPQKVSVAEIQGGIFNAEPKRARSSQKNPRGAFARVNSQTPARVASVGDPPL